MVKRAIIHVGPHKTGSTYIQKMLVQHRADLLQSGYDYSRVGQNIEYGHHQIASALADPRKWSAAERLLTTALASDAETLVLSSENFDRLSVEGIQTLHRLLNEVELVLVYVKRNPPALLVSSWQEEVKHGHKDDWALYLWSHVSRPFASTIMNPCLVLDRFASVLGKDPFVIIDYDEVKRQQHDLFERFLDVIGATGLAMRGTHETINASLQFEDVEIVRLLNIIAAKAGIRVTANVRTAYLQCKLNGHAVAALHYLKERIGEHLVLQRIGDSFLFQYLQKIFYTQYGDRVVGRDLAPLPQSAMHDTILEVKLPHSQWYASKEVSEAVEALWSAVRTTLDETPLKGPNGEPVLQSASRTAPMHTLRPDTA